MQERLKLDESTVAWRLVDDEVVALDLSDSMYLGINPSGARLWKRLIDGATRDELVDELVTGFGIEHDRAAADVDAFLASLRERALLTSA